jgi:phospholipase/carboxylesterase
MGALNCRLVGSVDPEKKPELAVILCHGYGAPGTDLVPIGGEILGAHPDLEGRVRFLFPEAPISMGGGGFMDSRAWWEIDWEILEAHARGGNKDYSQQIPEGLGDARRKLASLVDQLQIQTGLPMSRIILGGFSQGAMLTTDLCLRQEEAPAALAVFSGTLLSRDEWTQRASGRAGLKVIQSHGTQDPVLPFASAERLHELFVDAGLEVEFIPFAGPHTIPAQAVQSLVNQIRSLLEN